MKALKYWQNIKKIKSSNEGIDQDKAHGQGRPEGGATGAVAPGAAARGGAKAV